MLQEFELVMRRRALQFDDRDYLDASETAVTILAACNYDPNTQDEMDEEISDTVQSHLMLAMLRAPRLEPVLFAAIHDHIKALADAESAPESSSPRHRAASVHTCQTQHPDDPTPCEACVSDEDPMLVCDDCGEAFDSIPIAYTHVFTNDDGLPEACGRDFRIVPREEAI